MMFQQPSVLLHCLLTHNGVFNRQCFDCLVECDGVTLHHLLDMVETRTWVCLEDWQPQEWGGFVEGEVMAADEFKA